MKLKKEKDKPETLDFYYNKIFNIREFPLNLKAIKICLLIALFFIIIGLCFLFQIPGVFFEIVKYSDIAIKIFTTLCLYVGCVFLVLCFYYLYINKKMAPKQKITRIEVKQHYKIIYSCLMIILFPGFLFCAVIYILNKILKINYIYEYFFEIFMGITIGYFFFLFSSYVADKIVYKFPNFEGAIVYWWLLLIVVISYISIKLCIYIKIKYIRSIADWKKEYMKTIKQLKLFGLYLMLILSAFLYPVKSILVDQTDKLICDSFFYITTLFTLFGTLMQKREQT